MDKDNKKIDLKSLLFGKMPPHSKDIEEMVLGMMLLNSKVIITAKEIISENDFYLDEFKIICKAIFEISNTVVPDIMMVAEWLKKNDKLEEIGGAYRLIQITNKVTSDVNFKQYCILIKEKSAKRKLIDFSGIVLSKALEDSEDLFELLIEAENKIKGINYELDELKITPISTIAMSVIEKFDNKVFNAKNNIKDENSIYTGFKEWDEINGSLFPGLFVVAGRPGMGKGVHMTELICKMGKNYNIGIVNGEMTDEQLLIRIGCNLMNIDNFMFKKNPSYVSDKEQELLHEAMNEALTLKIHIENNRNIKKIENKIRLWVANYNVKCVFADFLTLFKVPRELEKYYTKTQQVDYILDVFTQLCKDLKIPIILYVQMNREILGRSGTKEPNLADLKQSGSIEELAYQVSFLHRPEYYDDKANTDEMGESTKGLCYQIISKHRDGKLGRIKLRANLPCSQMKEWDDNSSFSFSQQSILNDPF